MLQIIDNGPAPMIYTTFIIYIGYRGVLTENAKHQVHPHTSSPVSCHSFLCGNTIFLVSNQTFSINSVDFCSVLFYNVFY